MLAHLPRFNARLCEHLFGAGDGAHYLQTLQALGCFIEPWRDCADWLQIFTPLTQLMREEHWPQARSWHRRACQWFAAERDWEQFHTPKNLVMALMVEAAELAEIFQWMTPEQSLTAHSDRVQQEHIGDEVADVLLYLLQLADHSGIDLKRAVGRKLVKNAKK